MGDLPIWSDTAVIQNNNTVSLPTEVQLYIKEAFWPRSKSSLPEYSSYFRYFQWTVSILTWPQGVFDRHQFAAQTYADLTTIVRSMKLNADHSRVSIASELRQDFPNCSRAQILRSMDLTIRLWLTVYMRSDDCPVGPALSDITQTSWPDGVSLRRLLQGIFEPNLLQARVHHARIDPSFTVKKLRKLCRVNVQWTANLMDHLKYDRATSTLYLFPHKSCLMSHLESCDVLPKALVAETVQTLDLLFPFGKESTRKYLDENSQTFYRTSSPDLSRPTDFQEFHYWRKRLIELHDVYNDKPKSILQMWYDRRNPIQWWTFWLAAAIAIITIIFGVISAYTGFKQVSLAQKSFDLALLQACSQQDLPGVCKR